MGAWVRIPPRSTRASAGTIGAYRSQGRWNGSPSRVYSRQARGLDSNDLASLHMIAFRLPGLLDLDRLSPHWR